MKKKLNKKILLRTRKKLTKYIFRLLIITSKLMVFYPEQFMQDQENRKVKDFKKILNLQKKNALSVCDVTIFFH